MAAAPSIAVAQDAKRRCLAVTQELRAIRPEQASMDRAAAILTDHSRRAAAGGLRLRTFLLSIHGIGDDHAEDLCRLLEIKAYDRRLRDLTERQVGLLAEALRAGRRTFSVDRQTLAR